MKDWVSLVQIQQSHGHNSLQKYREMKERWSEKPSESQLEELRKTLESYIPYAAWDKDRELIQAVLDTPKLFEKARIINDGSWLSFYFYAYKVKDEDKLHFWILGSAQDSRMDPEHDKHIGISHQSTTKQRIRWILKNYEVIPFLCYPIDELFNRRDSK